MQNHKHLDFARIFATKKMSLSEELDTLEYAIKFIILLQRVIVLNSCVL